VSRNAAKPENHQPEPAAIPEAFFMGALQTQLAKHHRAQPTCATYIPGSHGVPQRQVVAGDNVGRHAKLDNKAIKTPPLQKV
jgi:hypothetical protein